MSFLLNFIVVSFMILFALLDISISIEIFEYILKSSNENLFFIGTSLIIGFQVSLFIEFTKNYRK